MTVYDLTPRITHDLAVWPGDTPPTREVLCSLDRGDSVTLSTLRATVHLGAHADGPNHYQNGGSSIDQMPLRHYLGDCELLAAEAQPARRFGAAALRDASGRRGDECLAAIAAPRILIRTGSFTPGPAFATDFAAPDPSLIRALAERGVITIGVDTPSVDLFESKDLPAHAACAAANIAILEGLLLSQVPLGRYNLIALPLPLVGFDASPVRAVLCTRS
jgi:arylformamidase